MKTTLLSQYNNSQNDYYYYYYYLFIWEFFLPVTADSFSLDV